MLWSDAPVNVIAIGAKPAIALSACHKPILLLPDGHCLSLDIIVLRIEKNYTRIYSRTHAHDNPTVIVIRHLHACVTADGEEKDFGSVWLGRLFQEPTNRGVARGASRGLAP